MPDLTDPIESFHGEYDWLSNFYARKLNFSHIIAFYFYVVALIQSMIFLDQSDQVERFISRNPP